MIFYFFIMTTSQKYTNPQLRDMIQELTIKGVIDYDQRKEFMESLYHKYRVHPWTEDDKKQSRKESKRRQYIRQKLIKLYKKEFP